VRWPSAKEYKKEDGLPKERRRALRAMLAV